MKNKLAYFISKSSMFGIGFLLLIKNNGKNSYISVILGTLLGGIIVYFYSKFKKILNKKSLTELFNTTKLGILFRIIYIIFCSLLISTLLILLTMFINAFYLVNTPKIIIVTPFVMLATYLSIKDKNILLNISNLLFYFSIFIAIIFSIFLYKYLDITNLLPIFNYNSISILKGSLIYASITSIPIILVLDYYDNEKNIIKDYFLGSITNFLIIFFTIIALDEPLLKIYSFPEYAVLKQIKMLNFIENIENLSAFGWYSEMFITLSLLISNLKNNLPKKYNLIHLNNLLTIIIFISTTYLASNYQIVLKLYYLYPIILGIFFIFFIIFYLYLKLNKKNNI